ncbi:hypothetical protein G4177_10895 [Corallococcus sp. ZKHCc1 1396]|uniref:Uncharacterized protein n=1 Tax=Corallococcus soli TaxID=2710757 RepID=A0ABR9PL97_9BACT|nr:hypothetical protein [Corallococcus soli]MBE4748670.1 hypothetical protein [Corallococcus soli]
MDIEPTMDSRAPSQLDMFADIGVMDVEWLKQREREEKNVLEERGAFLISMDGESGHIEKSTFWKSTRAKLNTSPVGILISSVNSIFSMKLPMMWLERTSCS